MGTSHLEMAELTTRTILMPWYSERSFNCSLYSTSWYCLPFQICITIIILKRCRKLGKTYFTNNNQIWCIPIMASWCPSCNLLLHGNNKHSSLHYCYYTRWTRDHVSFILILRTIYCRFLPFTGKNAFIHIKLIFIIQNHLFQLLEKNFTSWNNVFALIC